MATIDTKAFFALVNATKEKLFIDKDPVSGDIKNHQVALNEFFQNSLVQETYAKLGIATPKDVPLVPDDDLGPKTTDAYKQFFLGTKVALIHLDTASARAENDLDIYRTIDPLIPQLERSSPHGSLEYVTEISSNTNLDHQPILSNEALEKAIRSPLTKDSIGTIQEELIKLDLNPGTPDKILGPKTSGALAEYFKANLNVYQTMHPMLQKVFASYIKPEDFQHLEKQSKVAAEIAGVNTTSPSITQPTTVANADRFRDAAKEPTITAPPDSVQIPDNSISLYVKEGFESVSGPLIKELTDRGIPVFATYEKYEGSTHLYEQEKLQATPITNANTLGNIEKLSQIKLENIPEDYRGRNPESALSILRPRNQGNVKDMAEHIQRNLASVAITTVLDENRRNNTSYLNIKGGTYRRGQTAHRADWERGKDNGGGVIKLQLGTDIIKNPTNFPHIVAESVAQEFGLAEKRSPGQLAKAFKILDNTTVLKSKSTPPDLLQPHTFKPGNGFIHER